MPGDVVTLLGALAIIALMLVGTWHATRWYARKSGGFAPGSGRYIRVLDQARLGAGSLVIVEAGGAYYLLGLSDKNMQLICRLEDFAPAEPASAGGAPFARIFSDLLSKRQKTDSKDDGGGS